MCEILERLHVGPRLRFLFPLRLSLLLVVASGRDKQFGICATNSCAHSPLIGLVAELAHDQSASPGLMA